ncbi:MAG: N5-glutamine S-adenosyl-L-methionine-dependent methyltransferase [Methanoregulaceae archaeon PtaU1.Bin059]|jgi:release factor glutamine methyltransferase|nr:MAG: N5-glutamine S-adenosyl-L-methionine-dependent methyltransferase [Methanoregulaceae archaeon PtaB.Bin009]OPY35788.1 MAG: N5-glutamine S-adenosyl-L-methionine-dependent methyltransferase [Methanoregulaceae archaeon PtaU1.Bin059]HNQ28840.1 methyltransferase [Methanolinea sp.]
MHVTHPQVYPPQEDTYLLLEAALQEAKPGDFVLEVGCGSGHIAGILAGKNRVLASDINPHAVRETYARKVDAVRADLLAGIRGPFDLVIFNPPYLPTLPDERIDDWLELALDGGRDGREVIGRFAVQVGRVLAPGGRVLLLLSSLTGLERIRGIFSEQGFDCEIVGEGRVEGEILYAIRCIPHRG